MAASMRCVLVMVTPSFLLMGTMALYAGEEGCRASNKCENLEAGVSPERRRRRHALTVKVNAGHHALASHTSRNLVNGKLTKAHGFLCSGAKATKHALGSNVGSLISIWERGARATRRQVFSAGADSLAGSE